MKTLELLAEKLNEMNIIWAIGASTVLYFNGHEKEPNDIDLFIEEKDYEGVRNNLLMLGNEKIKNDDNDIYNTQRFTTIVIDETEIDIIAGFYIRHIEGEFRFVFDEKSIDKVIDVGNQKVNIMALEDWYILYQLIPGRERKVQIIKDLLEKKEKTRVDLINRALELELPTEVRKSAKEIIK